MKVCGNPRCHCASDPAARHGPYYEWSYLKGRKLRHRTLTSEQADIIRLAIANHRKAKKLLRAWEAQTLHLIELKAPNEPRSLSPRPRWKLPGNASRDLRNVSRVSMPSVVWRRPSASRTG